MIRPKEVTLISRTQPSGPLCLWQCLASSLPNDLHKVDVCCAPEKDIGQ